MRAAVVATRDGFPGATCNPPREIPLAWELKPAPTPRHLPPPPPSGLEPARGALAQRLQLLLAAGAERCHAAGQRARVPAEGATRTRAAVYAHAHRAESRENALARSRARTAQAQVPERRGPPRLGVPGPPRRPLGGAR